MRETGGNKLLVAGSAVMSPRRLGIFLSYRRRRPLKAIPNLTRLSSFLRVTIIILTSIVDNLPITRPQRHVLPPSQLYPFGKRTERPSLPREPLQACSGWRVPQRSPSAARRALYPRPTCTSNPKHAHTPLLPEGSQGQTASEPNGQGRCRSVDRSLNQSINQPAQPILSANASCMVPPAESI
jgi:hypothetical protein